MKIETKLNIATALAVIVFGFALCASAVTADWESVKRLVGDAASGGSNNVSAAVSTLRGEIASATPSDYGSVKSAALSAVQPNDLEPYCKTENARQIANDAASGKLDETWSESTRGIFFTNRFGVVENVLSFTHNSSLSGHALQIGDSIASNEGAVAIAEGVASGRFSVAIGGVAKGDWSVAISGRATAEDATAIGSDSRANGERSVVIGPGTISAADAISLGCNTARKSAAGSILIGNGITAESANAVVISAIGEENGVTDNGSGSISLYPQGGISNLWIGSKCLADYLGEATPSDYGSVKSAALSAVQPSDLAAAAISGSNNVSEAVSTLRGEIASATPSDYNTVKSNASAGSSHAARTDNPHGVTAAQIGAASADDLAPLASDISLAYQYARTISLYMTGNTNAWFAGTNYVIGADAAARTHFAWEAGMDAATVPCSMALWEIRDGVRQCVWDQRDWTKWYWSFKAEQMKAEINASNDVFRAAVNQQINSDDNHAWAKRYASSGRVNPDPSTTFIDTKSVCLSPGMSWETVATVDGCGYWTIVGDGAVIGGSGTNAVLDIKDFEGNSIIKITKGEHRLAWVELGEIVGQSHDSNGWVCFDMLADVQPVGYFSTTLESADFVTESDAGCPAQYTWENRGGGVWRVHYLLKPGIVSNALFAKFQVEVEGKTRIQYEADTVINGGLIFNGVKIAPVIPSGAAVGSTVTWKVVQ